MQEQQPRRLQPTNQSPGQPPPQRVLMTTGRVLVDPFIGKQISGEVSSYKVDTVIGKGGMGLVYLAYSVKDGNPVALKALNRVLGLGESNELQRFKREIAAMLKIKHPNVVKIYDAGIAENHVFFVMEYLKGQSLDALLKSNPGSLLVRDYVRSLLLHTGHGVQAAHDQGVWHRDLKPSNVFITEDGVVKLIDFGAAKHADSNFTTITATGMAIGTLAYMAPEVLLDKPFDHRIDIYSLGVMAYQLLSGRLPFYSETALALSYQITTKDPQTLRECVPELDIPPALDRIVMRALQKDPQSRFGTVAEMAQALEHTSWKAVPVQIESDAHAESEVIYRKRGHFWRNLAISLGAVAALAAYPVYHFRDYLANTYNTRIVPALKAQKISLPEIQLPYNAYIDSRPRGASVYEVGTGGTADSLGTTPLSRSFTGTHTLLIKLGSQSKRITVSEEKRRKIVELEKIRGSSFRACGALPSASGHRV
jgi:serine/threonine protein kinase